MKKIYILLAAILASISLCACGDNSTDSGNIVTSDVTKKSSNTSWELGDAKETGINAIDAYLSSNGEIDADSIYKSIEYTPEMFYGVYTLNNEEDDIDDFRSSHQYKEYNFTNGSQNIIPVPAAIYNGVDYLSYKSGVSSFAGLDDVNDMEVAILKFASETQLGAVACTYSVSGNKITYQEVNTDSSGKYVIQSDGNTFEYEFSFSGPYLTLSNGDESVTLTSFCFTDMNENDLEICGYSLPNSKLVDKLDYFLASNDFLNYACMRDGNYYDSMECKLTGDGRITIYLKDYDGNEFIKQYVYIAQSSRVLLDDFSVVLLDGENIYYYTDNITMREARNLGDTSLSDDEIEVIAEKKSDLLDALYKEFTEKGIAVTIDKSTGEMYMDSAVLFGGDSAEISSDGKALIDKFLEVYTSVAYSGEYDGFISKTVVEGHTAPLANSTYESGLELSQQRADNVKDYILSGTSVDVSKISSTLEAVGCSNSKPIYGSDGEVDVDACRRVSFRFVVNTGE